MNTNNPNITHCAFRMIDELAVKSDQLDNKLARDRSEVEALDMINGVSVPSKEVAALFLEQKCVDVIREMVGLLKDLQCVRAMAASPGGATRHCHLLAVLQISQSILLRVESAVHGGADGCQVCAASQNPNMN